MAESVHQRLERHPDIEIKDELRKHIMHSSEPIDKSVEELKRVVDELTNEDDEGLGLHPKAIRAYLQRYDEKV